MSTRTVRLDSKAEQALGFITKHSELTISGAIKKGLMILKEKLQESEATPYEIYQSLDLGQGCSEIPPSTQTRQAFGKLLKEKYSK